MRCTSSSSKKWGGAGLSTTHDHGAGEGSWRDDAVVVHHHLTLSTQYACEATAL